jgi:plasmid stabilization system protein ParE
MSYQYIFLEKAQEEYEIALNWYKEKSLKATENFVNELKRQISVICEDPSRYRNTYKNYRETSLKRFPYSIIYFIDEDQKIIVIQSIFHHRRNPRNKYKRK